MSDMEPQVPSVAEVYHHAKAAIDDALKTETDQSKIEALQATKKAFKEFEKAVEAKDVQATQQTLTTLKNQLSNHSHNPAVARALQALERIGSITSEADVQNIETAIKEAVEAESAAEVGELQSAVFGGVSLMMESAGKACKHLDGEIKEVFAGFKTIVKAAENGKVLLSNSTNEILSQLAADFTGASPVREHPQAPHNKV